MSGCLVAALIVLAVGGLGGLGTCATCMVLAAKAPAEARATEEANAKVAAEAAVIKARQADELEQRFRKDCKRVDAGAIFPIRDEDLKTVCVRMIENGLKVPGSGDFPNDEHTGFTTTDGCKRTFAEDYTAKNAFGVVIRSSFECTYDPRTGDYAMKTGD